MTKSFDAFLCWFFGHLFVSGTVSLWQECGHNYICKRCGVTSSRKSHWILWRLIAGDKTWFRNGKYHRTDGPAIEGSDGYKEWYLNGVLHRTDGPAVEDTYGYKYWFLNGTRHRTDGPAIEHADGSKSWWLNGTQVLSEDLFLKLTGPIKSLPLYLGLGFDQYISERIKNESSHL